MRFKYIRSETGSFAIFSQEEVHADMARSMRGKIIGAGFCSIGIGYYNDGNDKEHTIINIHCYGESISLGVNGNKKEDEDYINKKVNDKY